MDLNMDFNMDLYGEFPDVPIYDDYHTLPGFRYCYMTRRYFRTECAALPQPSKLELKAQTFPNGSTLNIPSLLRSREMGGRHRPSFTAEAMNLKMFNWECRYTADETYRNSRFAKCVYLKPFRNCAFGTWLLDKGRTMQLRAIDFNYLEASARNSDNDSPDFPVVLNSSKKIIKTMDQTKPTDLCIGKCGRNEVYMLFVSNSLRFEGPSSISVQSFDDFSSNDFIGIPNSEVIFSIADIVESCALNPVRQQIAVGFDDRIILNSGATFSREKTLRIVGRPMSMEYSSDGSLLYYGLNYGVLRGFDLRAPRRQSQILDMYVERGLHNMMLLEDQQTMVVSAYSNLLGLIDLRIRKNVLEFPHHVNKCKNLCFTLDEKLNMICCSGQDNYTRIWSLREGKLLSFVEPILDEDSQSFSWLHVNTARPLVHIFHDEVVKVFEPKVDGVYI